MLALLLTIFFVFLKIGTLSFGGGYGMIALLEEEVLKHGWLTEEEFLNFIAVCESTPGPIAVNMATFIGSSQAGILGSLVATLGVVLPAFLIMLLIASILKNLLKYKVVNTVLNTIQPIVTGLIMVTVFFLFTKIIFNFKQINDNIEFNFRSFIVLIIVSGIGISYKLIKKKSISPILLIIISAVLGIIVNLI